MTTIITAERAAEIVAAAKAQLTGPAAGAPLYDDYRGGDEVTAYIELDLRDGELDLETYRSESSVSGLVWSGVITRFGIDPATRRDSIEKTLDAIGERLPAILAGTTIEEDRNGRDQVSMNEEATNLVYEIKTSLETYDHEHIANLWATSDWIANSDLGVTADTTDDELAALIKSARQEIDEEGIILVGDSLEDVFENARQVAISDRLAA